MKKLMMVAFAVIACAMTSNAATTNWKYNQALALKAGYKVATGTSTEVMASQTMYLFDVATISQSDLLAAVVADNAYDLSTKALASLTTDSAGKNSTGVTFSSEAYTVGSYYNFYAATVVDKDADGKYDYIYLTASTANIKAQDSSKTTAIGPIVGSSANALKTGQSFAGAGWYSTSVPEPTSGLLMLVGMAGLALRRRRA